MSGDSNSCMVRVWDPLIRIGHWVLVVAFATAYLSEGEPEWLHSYAGYAIAVTVAMRVVWGFIGPRHARFSDFVTGPGQVLRYLSDLILRRSERHLGHSPAGGAMTLALLVALALTALSGMATLAVEEGRGPLAGIVTTRPSPGWATEDEHAEYSEDESFEAFEEIHEFAANATLFLIVLHIAGVVWASLAHGENLPLAMITGRKRVID